MIVGHMAIVFSIAVNESNFCGDYEFVCKYVMIRLAMKLLDKKRIKVKKGEYLAVNERNMLAKVGNLYTCTQLC